MTGAGTGTASDAGRLGWSLAASCAAHVAVAALLVWTAVPPAPEHPAIVLPVSLVSLPGGGGGGSGPEPPGPAPAPPAPTAAVPAPPAAAPTPRRPARAARPRPARRVARKPAAPAPAAEAPPAPVATAPTAPDAPDAAPGGVPGGTGVAGGGAPAGSGGGDGTGGDGSGGARVAYGMNPLPPYPLAARRLGHEGVVLLDVLVQPDGRAAEVAVSRSSGHPTLDESARTTVRDRWRFVPARRGGQPVASRVQVPIRFRLDDVRGG